MRPYRPLRRTRPLPLSGASPAALAISARCERASICATSFSNSAEHPAKSLDHCARRFAQATQSGIHNANPTAASKPSACGSAKKAPAQAIHGPHSERHNSQNVAAPLSTSNSKAINLSLPHSAGALHFPALAPNTKPISAMHSAEAPSAAEPGHAPDAALCAPDAAPAQSASAAQNTAPAFCFDKAACKPQPAATAAG